MKNRSITGNELKKLTGHKTLPRAITDIALRMQKRTWRLADKIIQWSGINWEKDYVSFSLIESAGDNTSSYRFWRVSIEDALDCISGKLDGTTSLERTA